MGAPGDDQQVDLAVERFGMTEPAVRSVLMRARKALRKFWKAVSDTSRFSPLQRTPMDKLTGNWTLDASPAYVLFEMATRMVSPYQFNPHNANPLRDVLTKHVDFAALRADGSEVARTRGGKVHCHCLVRKKDNQFCRQGRPRWRQGQYLAVL